MYEETKEHFAEICECIWNRILSEEKMDEKIANRMRECTAQFALFAWNMSNLNHSLADTKKSLKRFADQFYEGSTNATEPLFDAAELKWREYRDDKTYITSVEVKKVNGKPRAVAFIGREADQNDKPVHAFRDFMESKEIQERLAKVKPEDFEAEIGKIIEEYNARIDAENAASRHGSPEETFYTDEYLRSFYADFQQLPAKQKAEHAQILRLEQSYVMRLLNGIGKGKLTDPSLDATKYDALRELIIAFYAAGREACSYHEISAAEITQVNEQMDYLEEMKSKQTQAGSGPIAFIEEVLAKMQIPENTPGGKAIRRRILAIALAIAVQMVEDFEDDYKPVSPKEKYDFDRKNLNALQLHVKLLGYRTSIEIQVLEDCTFDGLSQIINALFRRDNDHLYRFECDDGCVAVLDEEELEDGGTALARKCYIGHHLKKGSGAYYLFDYGDEWEHDITVKKILKAGPKSDYPKIVKITGEIPEQYPDCEGD